MTASFLSIVNPTVHTVHADAVIQVTCTLGLVRAATLHFDFGWTDTTNQMAAITFINISVAGKFATMVTCASELRLHQPLVEVRTGCISGTSPFETFPKSN